MQASVGDVVWHIAGSAPITVVALVEGKVIGYWSHAGSVAAAAFSPEQLQATDPRADRLAAKAK